MKRGPYKQYLNPNSLLNKLPSSLKKRRGITEADLNLSREEEVALWLQQPSTSSDQVPDQISSGADEIQLPQDNESTSSQDNTEQLLADDSDSSDSSSTTSSSSSSFSNQSAGESYYEEGNIVDNDEGFVNTPNPFKALQDYLKNNSKAINMDITLNPAEIIMMLLTLSITHDFTLTAIIDIITIINVICCCNILPHTRYLFKKLFNPAVGTEFHLVCRDCMHYLGKQGSPGITRCSNCEMENEVTGYRYDYAFVTLDIKSQLLDILGNKKCKFSFNSPQNTTVFSDINCGNMYRKMVPFTTGETIQYISFTFNVDSTPISKDSKTSITPIYLMINELDVRSRRKNLILAGVWYGKVKPRIDVFLKPFTDTLNSLRDDGMKVNVNGVIKTYKLLTVCCCVDTVARAPLQGLIGVNGYYCCSWCEIKGCQERNTVKYSFQSPAPPARTEKTFRESYIKYANGGNQLECKGVISVTPLVNLMSFNIVWGFSPDYLHCCLLGVVKRFLGLWFSDKCDHEYYIGAPRKVLAIDTLLGNIKYPHCLKRSPVLIKKRKVMKGRELENWLLYYSVPMLKGILHEKFITHWKLLVCAVSMLLQDVITIHDINEAELKLVRFVYFVDELYNDYEMTYNIHQLLHLAESCRQWGPLWTHTTFPFESGLRKAKRILKASRGVPQQIVRTLEMNRVLQYVTQNHDCSEEILTVCKDIKSFRLIKNYVCGPNETFTNLLGTFQYPIVPILGLPENTNFIEFEKLIKDDIVYKINNDKDIKTDDSYVRLNDGSFARIKHILCVNESKECFIVLRKMICEDEVGLVFTKRVLGWGNVFATKFDQIHSTAIKITVDNSNVYVSSIPNKHYMLNL